MSRTGPQPLFRDQAASVDVEAARRAPTLACAACGRLGAPRVMVGAGLDLHECRCGAYTTRWHCCGRVALSPAPTATYRAGAVCPDPECGVYRFGSPETPNLIGTLETVRESGLNHEEEE